MIYGNLVDLKGLTEKQVEKYREIENLNTGEVHVYRKETGIRNKHINHFFPYNHHPSLEQQHEWGVQWIDHFNAFEVVNVIGLFTDEELEEHCIVHNQ